jgi:hypothetical protein
VNYLDGVVIPSLAMQGRETASKGKVLILVSDLRVVEGSRMECEKKLLALDISPWGEPISSEG